MAYPKEGIGKLTGLPVKGHPTLYHGSEQPVRAVFDRMEEFYPCPPTSLEDLRARIYERTHGKPLSGVVREIRDEGW